MRLKLSINRQPERERVSEGGLRPTYLAMQLGALGCSSVEERPSRRALWRAFGGGQVKVKVPIASGSVLCLATDLSGAIRSADKPGLPVEVKAKQFLAVICAYRCSAWFTVDTKLASASVQTCRGQQNGMLTGCQAVTLSVGRLGLSGTLCRGWHPLNADQETVRRKEGTLGGGSTLVARELRPKMISCTAKYGKLGPIVERTNG